MVSIIRICGSFDTMRQSFTKLETALTGIQAEANAYANVIQLATHAGLGKARVFFIGNGGSAAIASHCAIDWLKNGGFTTFAFNDGASLTCITNDLGYDNVFALPIERHAMLGDLLFAISSSGRSNSILKAVEVAKAKRMNVVTLSGFEPDNPLLRMGAVNFYVPSQEYGTVEIAHLAILHSILDEIIQHDR
jgi:D-sedoheptulose 7-phosphate isomerase